MHESSARSLHVEMTGIADSDAALRELDATLRNIYSQVFVFLSMLLLTTREEREREREKADEHNLNACLCFQISVIAHRENSTLPARACTRSTCLHGICIQSGKTLARETQRRYGRGTAEPLPAFLQPPSAEEASEEKTERVETGRASSVSSLFGHFTPINPVDMHTHSRESLPRKGDSRDQSPPREPGSQAARLYTESELPRPVNSLPSLLPSATKKGNGATATVRFEGTRNILPGSSAVSKTSAVCMFVYAERARRMSWMQEGDSHDAERCSASRFGCL